MPKMQSAMVSEPEIAQALGNFVAAWATIELEMIAILGYLLNAQGQEADAVWASTPALGNKVQLMRRLWAQANHGNGLEPLLDRVQKMNPLRNRLVHSVWIAGDKKGELIRSYVIQGGDPDMHEYKRVTAADAIHVLENAQQLAGDLQEFRMSVLLGIPGTQPPLQQ